MPNPAPGTSSGCRSHRRRKTRNVPAMASGTVSGSSRTGGRRRTFCSRRCIFRSQRTICSKPNEMWMPGNSPLSARMSKREGRRPPDDSSCPISAAASFCIRDWMTRSAVPAVRPSFASSSFLAAGLPFWRVSSAGGSSSEKSGMFKLHLVSGSKIDPERYRAARA